MIEVLPTGIPSAKFININGAEHTFPEEVNNIGFSVTLLHNHPHAPLNYVLCYMKGFTTAEYLPREKAELMTPCSWYMENDNIIPYEFCEE